MISSRAGHWGLRGLFEIVEMKNMERSVALKQLGKILGKSFGYRVDKDAPDQDQREEARAKLPAEREKRDTLDRQKAERMALILKADAEYQRLKIEHKAAAATCSDLLATASRYRFTVGLTSSLFFMVKAQGDSWEEVIAKLKT